MLEHVISVDESDRPTGCVEKLTAHHHAILHRAFSVLIFDRRGRMLLQQRAAGKYHSAGLWTNACCGHPRPNEEIAAAAARRLGEELGVTCALQPRARHRYRAEVAPDMSENEIVHVFSGEYEGDLAPDPAEIASLAWIDAASLRAAVAREPDRYTAWFAEYVQTPWFARLALAP